MSVDVPFDCLSNVRLTVGWGRNQAMMNQGGFGAMPQEPGLKANMMNLIHSIRTVMRSEYLSFTEFKSDSLFMPVPLILLNILTILFKLIAG